MKKNLRLEIGDLCSLLQIDNLVFIETLRNEYKNFVSTKEPDITIDVKIKNKKFENAFSEPKIIFNNGRVKIERNDIKGEINTKDNKIRVETENNIFSFDSFLRILYSVLLVENNGFLIHAAGLSNGCIFTGPESSGKTTMAKRFPAYMVASDELIIVRKVNGHFLLYGTPFTGEIKEGKNIKAEVKKLFILTRDSPGGKLSAFEASAELLHNIICFTKAPIINAKLLELVCSFCSSVPCEKFNIFNNDEYN